MGKQSKRENYMDAARRVFDEFEKQERDRRVRDRAEREPHFARLLETYDAARAGAVIEAGE